jgi:DNA-directed RNA polymerase subunit A"
MDECAPKREKTVNHIIEYRDVNKKVAINYLAMEYRELLRHVQPGEQVGIRLAHHALSEATQSSLSAFHNAGLGSGIISRMSPSLQQIMDGVINNSNTSMVIKTNDETKDAISYRALRYYVNDITNSIVDISLNGKDFWYIIGKKMGIHPNRSGSTIFRFHINYHKLVNDSITLKYLADNIFKEYTTFCSPNFISLIDVHLENDAQISGMMELLERTIGVNGISECNPIDKTTFITTGSNLGQILNMYGVDNAETVSNNVYDVEKNFGIDAAREILYDEILAKVDNVHTAALIADFMTCKGYVAAFKKDNPMLKQRGFLSSIAFERPKTDIKNVIRNKVIDNTQSVYSQIITGQLPDIGSGSRLFSLQESDELNWVEW